VIHAAAVSTVAACYRDPAAAEAVNAQGSTQVAELAAAAGTRLVLVSSDLVFDGTGSWYTEQDAPAPLSLYGRTKQAAEQAVLAVPGAAVARVSLLFGPALTDRPAFFDQQLSALREHRPIPAFTDEWRTPLSLKTAARALVALAESDYAGVLHIGGPERLSRLEMAQQTADVLGLDAAVLTPTTREQFPSPEPRPRDTSLDSSRWRKAFPKVPWPGFHEALGDLLAGG
jgi:dTDP-4-dehydrorhamnose reductase